MKITLGNCLKLLLMTVGLFIITTNSASAVERSYYFSWSLGSDTAPGDGSEAHPFKSLDKVGSIIADKADDDEYFIYLKRGDTWNLTDSSNSVLFINKSHVTIDAYPVSGTDPKPIINGGGTQPAGLGSTEPYYPYGYAITVGETSTIDITNVYIRNIKFFNLYPGGGIMLKGKAITGKMFVGPGSIEYCDFDTIGFAAIYIYGVRAETSDAVVKIEYNTVTNVNTYPKTLSWTTYWPQAINGNANYNTGFECRFNKVWNNYGEGIGTLAFDVVEYNMVYDNKAPNLYLGTRSRWDELYTDTRTRIIRYNLLWTDSNGDYATAPTPHMRLDDEDTYGDNTGTHFEIYGNICIGGHVGIDLRNRSGGSAYGGIKVYNNTLIDNKYNLYFDWPQLLGTVIIKNNASIINTDSEVACDHYQYYNATSWADFEVGPNFWYGDSKDDDSDLMSEFQHTDNVFGTPTVSPLPVGSGWRGLTDLADFAFADFYPGATSQLIDSENAAILSGYDPYVTTGTDWETLPIENFVLADQDEEGVAWDFGAIINQQSDITPPSAPQGLSVE